MIPTLFALLADLSLSELYSESFLPWWEGFSKVFVGEDLLVQLGAAAGGLLVALVLTLGLRPLFRKITEAIEERDDWIESSVDWVSDNLYGFLATGFLWSISLWFDARNEAIALVATDGAEGTVVVAKNYILLRACASLAAFLLLMRAVPLSLRKKAYMRVLIWVISFVLLMNLLGFWEAIRDGLDRIQLLPVSDADTTRVTVLSVAKGLVVILMLVPLVSWVMALGERKTLGSAAMTPALRILVVKVMKSCIVVLAVLFGVSSLGIDLSALAFMGGAVGLGLGFGFQKVISNLISGVILLSDRSIKPGDVIEVDNTYGWINKLSARYVSVITRDGMEHLIPNETLITEKVTNWSFSDDMVRVKVPFGVSYNSDIHQVMKLAIQAGKETERVLPDKAPVCWLLGYGDSSVDFELRVWIRDPANGLNNLRSGIYVRMWDLFKEHGIEIPFPQRDLNFRGGAPIEVVMKKGEE
ncbi:transporter, MscS family [Verrucomicrobiia bacterium DG1235]|nr:transporter, MscS family [Verrucomicrobiae bacterium DG1235]